MKKVLKKLPLLILALVLVLAIKDKTYAATYGKLTYEVQDDGTIEITDCNESASGALTIPSTIDGKKVTSIRYHAFSGCSSLTSITIPEGVTSIGDHAFSSCSSLTSITIPNSVTRIENDAFSSCSSLTSITILGNVKSIAAATFFNCSSLTNITIPDSVTSIEKSAFWACSSLTSITIPDSVTSIGDSAFEYCSSLTSITIPDSVTSIGEYAFYDCSSLTSITIPDSVTSIGKSAFNSCIKLTSINVSDNNKNYRSIDGVLFNKDKTEIIKYPKGKESKSYKIPNGVTSIGDSAFEYCSSLTSITIPDSVTSIGVHAFSYCSSLTSITIPDSVISIGKYAFVDCSSLTSITIPDSVTSIGNSAFSGCSKLTSITIPDSVTSIGEYAFWRCSSLTSITIPNGVTSIGNSAFEDCSSLTSITIPNSVTSIEKEAFSGCRSLTSITIPNGVTSIGQEAFLGCSSLTSITIPNSVTSIGEYAFRACISLTSITIPNSVTSIGNSAFSYCIKLTSINVSDNNKNYSSIDGVLFNKNKTEIIRYPNGKESKSYKIPNGVTSIGNSAFEDCSSLTSITIPNSVTSIGNSAFEDCSSLTSITIPNSVTSIGNSAFEDCSSLTSITIPNSVTSIGEDAFSGCSKLTSINVSDNNKNYRSIDGVLFNKDKTEIIKYPNGKESKSYKIPNGVTSIGNSAFWRCSSLTSITIPDSVISIGGYDFYECSSLTKVLCLGNASKLGTGVFYECSSNLKIYAKNGLTGYETNGWENRSDKIVRYDETLADLTFTSRKQTGKVELSNDAFKEIASIKSYEIEDKSIVSVDSSGNVTPLKNGTTNVKAVVQYFDGTKVNLTEKIVVNVKSTGLVIKPSTWSFVDKYQSPTKKMAAKVQPIDTAFQDVTWKSSNTKVATVDSSGNVTAVGNGTCKITATTTDGYSSSGSSDVTVDIKAESINLDKTSLDITNLGVKEKLKADVLPSFSTINRPVKWSSSDTNVAKVDNDGNVTSVGGGICKITATTADGTNLSASCDVSVGIKVQSINFNISRYTISDTAQSPLFKPIISPSNATQKGVTWSSSNEKVATVDENGNVTAVNNGICKITATTTDGTNKTASCDVKVDIKAKSISFSLTSYTITNLGQTPSFTPKILPENTANKNVTWKSSDTSIATVSSTTGVINAVSNGTCKITATTKDGTNLSASMDIIVDIKAKSVALDKTSMQITSKNSINKLVATVTPSQASQKVAWSSSNGKIATVDSKGRVKAVSNGKCKIIATTTDGTNRTASCDVTVDIKFVTGISFDFNSYTITNVNQTPVFNPNITPSDAEDKSVRWSSSNTKVATVSSSGVIKAAGNGTCKITATTTDGTNLSASFNITVNIKATKMTLDKTKIELTTGKETEKITSSIEPSIANKAVKYTSSNTSIATVSSDGVVTAVGSGTCRIIATTTDGSKVTASCDVTVNIKTTGMKLDKTNYTFNKAETIKINPVITPSKASKKLTWTSSNTKVAIVSSDGKVTPVGKGTCKITATTTDGTNLSSSCNITSNVEYQKGDVNRDGKVNVSDVLYTMNKYMKGILTDEEKVIAEVTGDGRVNMNDVYRILAYAMGKISSL